MSDPSLPPYVPLRDFNWSLSHFGILPWNPTVFCLISSFFAVALYLSIELILQVWFTFKRHRALYYWSILITTLGIIGHVVAFTLKLFVPGENEIGSTFLAKISWVANTTGFSMVLYSRLHLVLRNSSVPHIVLAFILVDGLLFHTPVIVCSFGLSTPAFPHWVPPMDIAERIQIVGFTIQEFTISSIYTYTTWKMLQSGYSVQLRNVLILLVLAQIAVFFSDMVMVVVDYADMFTLKASMHPFIYAIKLKIEFVVLNQLRRLVRHGIAPGDLEVVSDDGETSQDSNWSSWKRISRLSWTRSSSWEKSVKSPPIPATPLTPVQPPSGVLLRPSEQSSRQISFSDVEKGLKDFEARTDSPLKTGGFPTLPSPIEENELQITQMERQYLGNFQVQS
ncbi:hypothetical protein NA57DRAFT_72465 [Rhizodiscina lignyota]|uniref:DUF7703 domain-containing protein n=1 Tax=Rhizodiscina lignyota TaxID=1504668 RepID=A0A9P4IL14_9PEZI|nr:hypothetical protein NA57DRAFT_72465 [Rhizodiscina lignyota]